MPISKEKLLYLTSSILGLSTGIASNIGEKLIESGVTEIDTDMLISAGAFVSGGIAVNLLSNTAQNIYSAFEKKVIIKHPNELNHDLKKALLTSIKRSLRHILVLYVENNPTKEDIKEVKLFLQLVEKELLNMFQDAGSLEFYNEQMKLFVGSPLADANLKIYEKLKDDFYTAKMPLDFVKLFVESYANQLRLCFSEELKDKGKAWIAFEKMMLEAIKTDLESLLSGQKKIEDSLDKIKINQVNQKLIQLPPRKAKAIEHLLQEINQPSRIKLQLSKALDELLIEVKNELTEIKSINLATYSSIKDFRSDYEKEKVQWWSRKMTAAYFTIFSLVVAILLIRYFHVNQPFGVTVLIHGPKGKSDIILERFGSLQISIGSFTSLQPILDNGKVYFESIPGEFNNDYAYFRVLNTQGEPYEILYSDSSYLISSSNTIYLPVVLKGSDKLNGFVKDFMTGEPIADVKIMAQGLETYSNQYGYFTLNFPLEKQQKYQTVRAFKTGYIEFNKYQFPLQGNNELAIVLKPLK